MYLCTLYWKFDRSFHLIDDESLSQSFIMFYGSINTEKFYCFSIFDCLKRTIFQLYLQLVPLTIYIHNKRGTFCCNNYIPITHPPNKRRKKHDE